MRMTRREFAAMHPNRERRPTVFEVAALMAQHVKRSLKLKGLLPPKPKKLYGWSLGMKYGVVDAHCRSDARGLIKQELGIQKKDRLPVEVHIVELDANANQSASA